MWGDYYVEGNVNTRYPEVTEDNWTYGIYNQIDANGNDGTYTETTKDTIRAHVPIAYEYVTTHTADMAYEKVLEYVGASLHRDNLDKIIVDDVREGKATFTASGNSKGIIDHPSDVIGDGWEKWPVLIQEEVKTDTDGDGMPDEWESANGLDPNDANDGNKKNDEGYTNLEVYLNSIVAEITHKQNEDGTAMSGQQVSGINMITCLSEGNDHIYSISGIAVANPKKKGIYIKNHKKIIVP